MNVFAKLFVVANRLTGAFLFAIGVATLVVLAYRIVLGLPLADTAWIAAVAAIVMIGIGWLYLRAPLSRKPSSSHDL